MFFGNPELLERNLHNDFNTLIKNVKARQDQYLTLLQYNKNLIANLAQIQNVTFVTDVINMHKTFLNASQTAHQKILIQQQQIKEKYVCVTSGESNITKLMGRVTSRVLQICQASYEKGKTLDPILNQKFISFKDILLQNLSQSTKINIQLIIQIIIEYSAHKNNKEIQRLSQIIKILINGQFQCLNDIYSQPKHQIKISPEKKQIIKQHKKSPSIDKQKQKQKQERARREEEARAIQKTKKKKAKVAKQLVTNIYSTMDLAKQQFTEDMNFTLNPQQKRKRLYEQIFSRNKFNYQQIIEFQSKKDEFQQKVKQFKQNMQEQSRRIQQTLVIVINKPAVQQKQNKLIIKQTPRKQTKSQAGQNQQQLDPVRPERLQRVFRRKQKKQPAKAQSPQFVKEVVFSAMQSTQQGFQHIKFDLKNQEIFTRSNRAKLPQIPGRSSLDNRYEGRSTGAVSQKKQQKRINIMKNVQIGMINTQISKNVVVNLSHNKRSPRQRPGAEPMFQNVVNIHQDLPNTNGLDYTFYVRKKINKFYQTRNNFIL